MTSCAARVALAFFALASQSAWAQTSAPPGKPKPAAAVASPAPSPTTNPEAPPPYEPQLLRLAELMGALSYLRDLCHNGDGAEFRDKIAKLMEVEAHTQERKDAIAGAFNRGFSDYELTYRTCTASARDTIALYLDESSRIAREVATRYGG